MPAESIPCLLTEAADNLNQRPGKLDGVACAVLLPRTSMCRWAEAWFASGGPVSGLFIGASGEGKRRDAGPPMFLVGMHLWRAWYISLVHPFILSILGVSLFWSAVFS